MSYIVGQPIELPVTFTDASTGEDYDPETVTLRLRPPTGTAADYTGEPEVRKEPGTGSYVGTVVGQAEGVHSYTWLDGNEPVGEGQFAVYASLTAVGSLPVPVNPRAFTPTVSQVALHIRSLTRDYNGREVGTFNADTRPTSTAVTDSATVAARFVRTKLMAPGVYWDGSHIEEARDAVAIRTALLIAESFYADGADPNDTGSDQLGRLAREQLDALIELCRPPDNSRGRRFARVESIVSEDPIADWCA